MRLSRDNFTQEMLAQDGASRKAELLRKPDVGHFLQLADKYFDTAIEKPAWLLPRRFHRKLIYFLMSLRLKSRELLHRRNSRSDRLICCLNIYSGK